MPMNILLSSAKIMKNHISSIEPETLSISIAQLLNFVRIRQYALKKEDELLGYRGFCGYDHPCWLATYLNFGLTDMGLEVDPGLLHVSSLDIDLCGNISLVGSKGGSPPMAPLNDFQATLLEWTADYNARMATAVHGKDLLSWLQKYTTEVTET
jgi:hypothetical protein